MNSLFRTARYQPKPAQDGADGDAFAPDCPPPMGLEDYGFAGPITDSYASAAGFPIKRWSEITFDLDEEYLIDGILPRQGVGLLYGASQAFKSFIVVVGPGETSRSALFSISPQRAARGSVSARPGTSRPGVTFRLMRTSLSSRPLQILDAPMATWAALSQPLRARASNRASSSSTR